MRSWIPFVCACAFVTGLMAGPAKAQPREPMRLHPDNPHYLLWRGKPTILVTSGEHYGAVLNLDFDYKRYLDELKSKGLNLTRAFSGTYREVPGSFGITDNTLAPAKGRYVGPWARSDQGGAADGGNKFDLSRFDPAYFERLKGFMAAASERGVVVEYVFFCPFYEEDMWAANPMNARNNVNGIGDVPRTEVYTLEHEKLVELHKAFVRKVVAELKEFDNLYYEICNEPYFGGVTLEWQAVIARTIAEAEEEFPHKHLIAQNIANGKAKIEKPDPLVSIFNFHYATPPDAVAMNYGLNRVLGDDETGFNGKADATYRTEGWDFIVAGGAIYSSLDYSFTAKHPDGSLRDYKSPGGGSPELREQLGLLKRFMEGFEFVRMRPMNGIVKAGEATAPLAGNNPAQTRNVTVRVLGEAGKQYAIYVRGGSRVSMQVGLPAGTYAAEWVNTVSGAVDKSEAFELGADGVKALESPAYKDDVALRIKRK